MYTPNVPPPRDGKRLNTIWTYGWIAVMLGCLAALIATWGTPVSLEWGGAALAAIAVSYIPVGRIRRARPELGRGAAEAVECPHCGAAPGQQCWPPARGIVHRARAEAWRSSAQ